MKKKIKWGIIGAVVLISIVGTVIAMMMPIPVRMTEVVARTAELTFTEQGIVSAENTILIFSATQGELNGIYVREGQHVNAGDVLISVDNAPLRLQLDQVQSNIRSLEAQLANVDVEDAMRRQDLTSSRSSLQGELRRINAQASETHRTVASAQETLSEQIRIQQIIIDQSENELARAREHLSRVNILYQNGAASRAELNAATDAAAAAQGALDTARGRMSIIEAESPETNAEIFEGMRASITAQISGIDRQLAMDTTSAARTRFEAMIEIEQANATRIEREIANSRVTAPTSGIITTLHAQGTNFISAAAPIAEITVPGAMSVDVYVSTQDIGSINVGDIAGLTLRQRFEDIELTGTITNIGSTAVVRHTALGVEERKVSVEIEPHIPAEVNLGVGHALDVTFHVFREENQIIVPRTSVFRVDGQDMVWAVRGGDSGRVEAVSVITGRELRTDIIILSGLNEGDFVINAANNADISQGTRVVRE